ncbi:MAG: hypothetical protein KBT03_09700 [Bacteroidales bacterium]|nr:hypothetical protein [Candidatus Scybalousia scybalohippi]
MKIGKFIPDVCYSGTGPAVKEFNLYSKDLEEAHKCKVKMIKIKHRLFGSVKYIKYEIQED